jgi:DNA repair ATPase RecN
MTKEQDKAIERCNKLIETEHSNWIGITNQKAIETVLNMLKEKDAEIEKLRKHNKELLRKLRNRVKEVKKLQKNPNYKAIVTKQGKTLEERAEQIKKYKQLYNKALDDAVTTSHDNMKKDKMIDLMAEYISDLDIDEDICKKQSDNNCDDINREVECKECIKQYFERKVTYERKRQS